MADDALPVFKDGVLQGNLTSDQGTAPTGNNLYDTSQQRLYVSPSAGSNTSSAGSSATDPYAAENAANAQLSGIAGDLGNLGSFVTGIGSGNLTGNVSGSSNKQSGIAGAEVWAQSWFIRFVVIILGFIFIAAGLRMLGQGTPVARGVGAVGNVAGAPIRGARRVANAVRG